MNHQVKVSVLVPVFGVEKYIEKCATSLFEQNYSNIEYIFVNDCTKDHSIDILRETLLKYPCKNQVKIISHNQNSGLSAARNTALENATGEYVLPIDSDDFLTSNTAITELIEEAVKNDADGIFYNLEIYPSSKVISYDNATSFNPSEFTKDIIERNVPMNLCGGLYRRSLFIDHNIRSQEQISMGEDYAIKPLLTYNMKKIVYLPKVYYAYRQENQNSITKIFKTKHVQDLRYCMDLFQEFFREKDDRENFLESINIAQIRCKILCIKSWLGSKSTFQDFNLIQKLFPAIKCRKTHLTKEEYLLYKLASYNLSFVLKWLFKGKQFVKLLKK